MSLLTHLGSSCLLPLLREDAAWRGRRRALAAAAWMAAVVLAAALSFPYSGEEGILTLRYNSRNAWENMIRAKKKLQGTKEAPDSATGGGKRR